MSGDPIDALKRFYAAETAFLSPDGGNFGPVAATLDANCVLHQPATLPYGGEWLGPAGFEAWMKAFRAEWATLEVRDPQFYPTGDVIIVHSHVYATARRTGRSVDWPLLQFIRVRNGLIFELRPFHWDTAALLPALEPMS